MCWCAVKKLLTHSWWTVGHNASCCKLPLLATQCAVALVIVIDEFIDSSVSIIFRSRMSVGSMVCLIVPVSSSPLVIWRCWLGIRKSIRRGKKLSDEVLAWLSVWSEVQIICMWSSWCHCHSIVSCFIKIQIGLTFLVPTYPGCPGKEAVRRASVSVVHLMKFILCLWAPCGLRGHK